MKKSIALLVVSMLAGFSFVGCTRIDTGEIGLRKTFGGEIQTQELGVGWHQTMVGDVIVFAAKEILLPEENMTPASKDKSTLKDFDINFTYVVEPSAISDLYVKYSMTAHLKTTQHNEIFPMATFVAAIVRAAGYSSVAEFDALEVNNNRKAIEDRIKVLANDKLASEGLAGKLKVNLVNIKNIQLADEIVSSANMVSNVQNQLTAKKTEVQIAVQEGLRIKALSDQTDAKYVNLLNAQASMKTAEALNISASKGSTIWVVPNNFVSIGGSALVK
jgi:hypothetical protein